MQDYTARRKKRSRWEFLLLLLLLVPVGVGAFFLLNQGNGTTDQGEKTLASVPQEGAGKITIHGEGHGTQDLKAVPPRTFPTNYKVEGTIDDRYTVAIDPKTGEMLIHDAEAGIGSNTTSVEGQRRVLVKDMLDLQRWADENKGSVSSETYNWARQTASSGVASGWAQSTAGSGMAVAYGAPGMLPQHQSQVRQDALQKFYTLASNPPVEFINSQNILTWEKSYMPVPNPNGTFQKQPIDTLLVSGYQPMYSPTGTKPAGTLSTAPTLSGTSLLSPSLLSYNTLNYSSPTLTYGSTVTPTLAPTTTLATTTTPTLGGVSIKPTTSTATLLSSPTSTTTTKTANMNDLYSCTLYGNCAAPSTTTVAPNTTLTSPTLNTSTTSTNTGSTGTYTLTAPTLQTALDTNTSTLTTIQQQAIQPISTSSVTAPNLTINPNLVAPGP